VSSKKQRNFGVLLPSLEFCGFSSSFLHPQGEGKRKWCGAVTAVRIRLRSAMKSMASRKFLLSSCIFSDALVL
jgi:hypothetical protein